MSLKQAFTLLFLVTALTSAFAMTLIVLFDNLLDTLAAHAHELAQLSPQLVVTTVIGVFAFMGVSLLTKAVVRWARIRHSSEEEETTEASAELDG
jgi:hypothetical protein